MFCGVVVEKRGGGRVRRRRISTGDVFVFLAVLSCMGFRGIGKEMIVGGKRSRGKRRENIK